MNIGPMYCENRYIGWLAEDKIDSIVYLNSGLSFTGALIWADKDTVYLREKGQDNNGQVKMIYKRAISAISPAAP